MDIYERFKEVFGSFDELAEKIGIAPQAIYNWRRRGQIPAEQCPAIVRACGGRIDYHEMRPDIYPNPSQAA